MESRFQAGEMMALDHTVSFKKELQHLGPSCGKLYRSMNKLGNSLADANGNHLILSKGDIVMVTYVNIGHNKYSGHHMIFSVLFGEQVFENLVTTPVWFDHNFKRVL